MKQKEVNEFPQEVIKELKHYVYRLIDPRNGETFYVGRGKDNRVFNHVKGNLKEDDMDDMSEKKKRITEIINSGLKVIHIIHRHGMDKDHAIEVEAALIDAYPSATNVVSGQGSNDFGPMHALEIINKYTAEEAALNHNVLMITINRSISEKSIYDATRYAWKVDAKRAEKADYILAIEKGIIVGVFIADVWKKANVHHFPEFNDHTNKRYGFKGKEAPSEISELYLNKRIPDIYRKRGAANPIKYNYL